MRMLSVTIMALAATVGLTALAQESRLTAKEIQETWAGKTMVGTTASGASATMTLGSDGTAQLAAGNTKDSGTWRLSEQGYCTTWKNIRAGQERCFTVRRTGTTMDVLNPDGTLSGQFNEIK